MEEENGEEKELESTDGKEKANNGEEKAESFEEEEAEERMDGLGERMEAALKEAVVEKGELPQWIMGRGKARVTGKVEAQIPAVATIVDKQDIYHGIAHRREKERAKERTALGLGDSMGIAMCVVSGATPKDTAHGGPG